MRVGTRIVAVVIIATVSPFGTAWGADPVTSALSAWVEPQTWRDLRSTALDTRWRYMPHDWERLSEIALEHYRRTRPALDGRSEIAVMVGSWPFGSLDRLPDGFKRVSAPDVMAELRAKGRACYLTLGVGYSSFGVVRVGVRPESWIAGGWPARHEHPPGTLLECHPSWGDWNCEEVSSTDT